MSAALRQEIRKGRGELALETKGGKGPAAEVDLYRLLPSFTVLYRPLCKTPTSPACSTRSPTSWRFRTPTRSGFGRTATPRAPYAISPSPSPTWSVPEIGRAHV